jgi:energy-coupling factor transporter ATP-binding protein EcfA2
MITSFAVKSFKSLEDVEVKLGRVNVFIGANGSGKSNFLEAIGVLGAAANGRVDDEALLRRGVRPGLPKLYKSSFKGVRQPPAIQFTAQNQAALYAVGLFNPLDNPEPSWRYKTELLNEGNKTIIGRSPANGKQLNPSAGYAALKTVELLADSSANQLLQELGRFAIYTPDTATLRGLISDPQSRDPVGLNGGRLAEAVEFLFRHNHPFPRDLYDAIINMIDWASGLGSSGIEDIPISKNIPQPTKILRFFDKYMLAGRDILSGYDASEGALYVLFMTVLTHHPAIPSLVAIDNFDQALNPRLARALTQNICDWVLQQKNKQVLLTSHNPLVLDGLPLQNDDVRLFTVERSRMGKTVIQRVKVSQALLEQAKKGVPLSQQWVMGTFGGVPRI